MWDLPDLAQIQKAKLALKAGRLNEAYEIAASKKLREYRKCQALLEDLVAPLLQRAEEHLQAERLDEALADVERAAVAGDGHSPELADLRDRILSARNEQQEARSAERKLLNSVKKHIGAGDLDEASVRLRDFPGEGRSDNEEAVELRRRVERARSNMDEAAARAEARLESGNLESALEALVTLQQLAPDDERTHRLTQHAIVEGSARIDHELKRGSVESAQRLISAFKGIPSATSALSSASEAVELIRKASHALSRSQWSEARVCLGRIARHIPKAAWVSACEKQLRAVDDALRELRASPLGDLASLSARAESKITPIQPKPAQITRRVDRPAAKKPNAPKPRQGKRYLLWVDGVGSFLVLTSDHVGIGRAGSSARPDVEISADIEGVHAQIVRVDHDYFLVARGSVSVRGRSIERHLLTDGDDFVMGSRSKMTFRLPSSMSSTARVDLGSGLRMASDVRSVILLDEHLIFGASSASHLSVPGLEERVILSFAPDGFRCRSKAKVTIDSRELAKSDALPFGQTVQAGSLAFTLTCVEPKDIVEL